MSTTKINVNLAKCEQNCPVAWASVTGTPLLKINRRVHRDGCPGTPVLLQCPIPSEVVLMRCSDRHRSVTCYLGGDGTWAGSRLRGVDSSAASMAAMSDAAAWASCNQRWKLIKALVLGKAPREWDWAKVVTDGETSVRVSSFFAQRDEVFVALTDMARAEEATCAARDAVRKARGLPPSRALARELRESAIGLDDYVKRLFFMRDAMYGELASMVEQEREYAGRSSHLFNLLKAADPERAEVTGPASYAMAGAELAGDDSNSAAGLRAFVEILLERVAAL
jgi:hypothetical protein